MPNGRPGDHPYTDVVVHGFDLFGTPIDDLIRRVADSGGCPEALGRLLSEHEPRTNRTTDLSELEAALRALLAERASDA